MGIKNQNFTVTWRTPLLSSDVIEKENTMAQIGITEEQREQMIDLYYKHKNIERKRPSKEELEKEIIDYLGKKHPCSLATCGKDGIPRISVVDYMNDGLTIYILSEGGQKFQNMLENKHVAIGIGTSARTSQSVRGVNIQGIAEIFDDRHTRVCTRPGIIQTHNSNHGGGCGRQTS